MPSYDAVLFDNDGVLVEPPAEEHRYAAGRAAFRAVGVETPEREHLDAIVGSVTPDQLHEVAGAYDLDAETLWDARERHDERTQLEQFRAGTRTTYDDVAALDDLSHPRGVVSNNHHTTVAFVLDRFDLRFDTYYGRPMTVESLTLKKPNPHYLDRALDDLGAETALYVGDSESDVAAAHNAGLDSAFVRRAHNRDRELAVEPTHEIRSLSELDGLVGR
ncbi:HAD family hydrolase [Halorarius litoreus]|uniref:HAD family hydrolase n=1 Tax=Halorarius litoreus TaxID=2962676 RepID=UPI0020CD9698|nr:HAD family hydrolase [Halorarius litoreus]